MEEGPERLFVLMGIRVGRVTVLCLTVFVLAGNAARPEEPLPLAPGETLTYEVTWSILPAGEVVATLSKVGEGPADSFEVKATARSRGVASLLYKVDDEFHSFFSAEHCSSRISKKTNEGRRRKDIQIVFDTARRLAVMNERDVARPNDPPKHAENEIPACVQDVISATYFLRRQPLWVGHEVRVPVNDGSKTYEVSVEVQNRDQVHTALGGQRAAFRVEPKIFGQLYKRKGRMLIWISDDDQRLPLRIRAESSVGSVTANLKSVVKPEKASALKP